MTTSTHTLEPPAHRSPRWIRHSLVLARRSLAKTSRNPGAIVNGVVTPALFLVVFMYLFGHAVAGTTGDYLQYLFPGILVMGAGLTGLVSTGTNLNIDLQNGVTDRFRSLPISRLAPLLGSLLADGVRYLAAVAILFGIGTALGFRSQGGLLAALAAIGIAVLFGFCLSWITVLIGVTLRSAEAVLAFSFLTFLPLQLGTSLATPAADLPGWLRSWVTVNPVSAAMDACRALFNGTPAGDRITTTLIWCAAIFLVFCPLAVWTYGRRE
jgi:oleandomycin transport system permease protein